MTLEYYRGKSVAITGVCGTVGSELVRQLTQLDDVAIVGMDNGETELFFMRERYLADERCDFYLGDLSDRDSLKRLFRGIDVVFHTAALKHVGLSERSPQAAVQCNIIGTQNVIEAALHCGVGQVNLTSSDKAVNPTNVMGTSKLMGERLMTGANAIRREGDPMFFCTRFGNVLGSRGSVIPLFRRQIAAGGPVTITDKSMSRFIMTLAESVELVMEAAQLARGGEVFVTKMPVANILDLALIMIEELAPRFGHAPRDIELQHVGPRPGEKLYEELLSQEESLRAVESGRFIIIEPSLPNAHSKRRPAHARGPCQRVERPYNSSLEPQMSCEELREYLLAHGLLGETPILEMAKCA